MDRQCIRVWVGTPMRRISLCFLKEINRESGFRPSLKVRGTRSFEVYQEGLHRAKLVPDLPQFLYCSQALQQLEILNCENAFILVNIVYSLLGAGFIHT
jgi:hypothetical protein